MHWIFLALLAPLLWTATNIMDKFLLEKYLSNALVYLFLTGAINLVVLLIIPFWGFTIPALPVIGMSLFAGALFNFQMLPYFKALQIADASRVAPLYQFTPIFTLLFAFVFLHEQLSPQALMAFVLLVVGGFLVALEKVEGVFKVSKALFYMLGACCLYALHLICSRYVYLHVPYFTGLAWETIGGFLGVLPFLLSRKVRHDVTAVAVSMPTKVKIVLGANELCNLAAIASVQLALVAGPASLVGALGSIQPLYVLLATAALSAWLPRIIHEDTTLKTLFHKSFATTLIVAGVILVSL